MSSTFDFKTSSASDFAAHNADAYEQVMGRWSRRLAPLVIQFGGLADGDRVLDVGCGTGSLSFALAEAANVATVAGIDQAGVYVSFARSRTNDPRFGFQQADARALPFPDARRITVNFAVGIHSADTAPRRADASAAASAVDYGEGKNPSASDYGIPPAA